MLITVVRLNIPPTKIASAHGIPVPISPGTSTRVANSAASASMPIASGGTRCHGWAAHATTAEAMMIAVISSPRRIGPSWSICSRTTCPLTSAIGGGRSTAKFAATIRPHQITVGKVMTRAYSNQVIGSPAFGTGRQ